MAISGLTREDKQVEKDLEKYSEEHAARSLLACDRCDYSVEPVVRDARGRLVSGYSELLRHAALCRWVRLQLQVR